jgi:hypothetical protein
MKGVRFYEELNKKNRKGETSQGNVVAVFYEQSQARGGDVFYDAGGAVHFHANSAAAGTSVSQEYLTKSTRRVSEERAREIHPALFTWLD